MLKYEILLYWSEVDQAVVAEVPELPGCSTHGDSYEEALARAQEAMEAWIAAASELGTPVPEPKGRRLMYA